MNWRTQTDVDQNGVEFPYGEQWAYMIDNKQPLSDGTEQCNTAKALEIAMDVMTRSLRDINREPKWDHHDIRTALAVLAGVRAQRGVVTADSDFQGCGEDGFEATHQIDIWVFG